MCGILIHKGNGNPYFIQRRGMDHMSVYNKAGLIFNHWLLNVTGELTPQPFVVDDIVCAYNGEIYNHSFQKSDGENLIPLYQKYGIDFVQHLDGEYAIALYDFKQDIAYFITDPFATKPLWRNGIQCASYQSGVGGHKVKANTIEAVNISTEQDISITFPHYEFDFNHQHKTNYDDCITAFIEAVRKRAKPECFIGLSSGYDSGAIACALQKLNVKFKCYCVSASENIRTLRSRARALKNVDIFNVFDIAKHRKHLAEYAENYEYNIRYDDNKHHGQVSYKNDYAAIAMSFICEMAHNDGRKVLLSGMGADEILSDYSLLPYQSEFKGKFPDKLYAWQNFYGSCMESYIGKEECVGGSWSIETRYPYLDKQFVQEFLWLSVELKNKYYKAPIDQFLKRNFFPYDVNKKIGFSI